MQSRLPASIRAGVRGVVVHQVAERSSIVDAAVRAIGRH